MADEDHQDPTFGEKKMTRRGWMKVIFWIAITLLSAFFLILLIGYPAPP